MVAKLTNHVHLSRPPRSLERRISWRRGAHSQWDCLTGISVVGCPLSRTVSGDDTIPHGQKLLHTKDVEGDLGACPEECHSNQRHHPPKRHLLQILAGARLNDRAGLVPVVHGHGPRHRRTSAIHLFQSRQGGQVRARLCV